MNRLHLPPPFGDPELFPGTLTVISEPWLPSALKSQPVQNPVSPVVNTTEAMDLSSSAESELQSDENECVNMESKHFVPKARSRKRRLFGHSRGSTQKLSIAPVAVSADAGKHSGVSELFEIEPAVQPKMQLHVPSELPSTTSPHMIAQSRDSEGGFGIMKPSNRSLVELPKGPTDRKLRSTFKLRKSPNPDDSDDALTPSCPVAEENASEHSQLSLSLNDLRLRRLTQEERQNYAVFAKNYAPGDPTSRLYIKNLSPLVTEEDLYRVYGAFQSGLVENVHFRPPVPTTSTDRLAIRLLTGGRMKGQAFVSLNSEQTAIQALEATNGLLLHDRPMVVQFARGAKGKVDENTLIT
ncbi:unnamed protein product [Dicrocoelium dendriticum]|nr:unnamed protein product [Dicrocoelium dendriticum]